MQLLCAAVIEELEPLLQITPFKEAGPNIFLNPEKNFAVAALGIGLVGFASGFQSLLENYDVDQALLTGTCGVYPGASQQWPIGSLVAPQKISLGDLSEVDQSGYFPAPITSTYHLDKNFSQPLIPDSNSHCLTLATITSSDQTAARIENYYHSHFEQMEAYSFAHICQERKITGSTLFAVANEVGREGHRQWRKHARQGSRQVAALLGKKFNLV